MSTPAVDPKLAFQAQLEANFRDPSKRESELGRLYHNINKFGVENSGVQASIAVLKKVFGDSANVLLATVVAQRQPIQPARVVVLAQSSSPSATVSVPVQDQSASLVQTHSHASLDHSTCGICPPATAQAQSSASASVSVPHVSIFEAFAVQSAAAAIQSQAAQSSISLTDSAVASSSSSALQTPRVPATPVRVSSDQSVLTAICAEAEEIRNRIETTSMPKVEAEALVAKFNEKHPQIARNFASIFESAIAGAQKIAAARTRHFGHAPLKKPASGSVRAESSAAASSSAIASTTPAAEETVPCTQKGCQNKVVTNQKGKPKYGIFQSRLTGQIRVVCESCLKAAQAKKEQHSSSVAAASVSSAAASSSAQAQTQIAPISAQPVAIASMSATTSSAQGTIPAAAATPAASQSQPDAPAKSKKVWYKPWTWLN